jgi:hypothetical protein
LTPELRKRICDYVSLGNFPEVAGKCAGIDRATFYRWKARGETTKTGVYRDFCDALKEAESRAEVAALAKIQKAATNGTWTAAAWLLERRFSDRWKRPELRGDAGDREPIVKVTWKELNARFGEALQERLGRRVAEDESSLIGADRTNGAGPHALPPASVPAGGTGFGSGQQLAPVPRNGTGPLEIPAPTSDESAGSISVAPESGDEP